MTIKLLKNFVKGIVKGRFEGLQLKYSNEMSDK